MLETLGKTFSALETLSLKSTQETTMAKIKGSYLLDYWMDMLMEYELVSLKAV